ncbi:glycosyltransferase [Anaerolinea thermolimosa]|uniref:glycosyltransferase n=1 Tax=Anaerolinea thermolimosa TaxID=229919 RepID=UPI0009FD7AF1|nr:glycosyltransferase [Anaerolinea thermolimosa]GAP07547.1 glycosyltransferase [Anaerolinea thermolimosa]
MKKKIAFLSLGSIDLQIHSRVLRQIQTLGCRSPMHVIAYGSQQEIEALPASAIHIVGSLSAPKLPRVLMTAFFLSIGRFLPRWGYEYWYWYRPGHRKALEILNSLDVDLVLANNWWSMPVASQYKTKRSSKIILDLHEYALDEFTDRGWLKHLYQPMIEYQFQRYLSEADATIVVNPSVAHRYHNEFGINPIVVMNAPKLNERVSFKPTLENEVKLVHHGYASPERQLERMIEIVGYLDRRFTLTFLLGGNVQYRRFLEKIAKQIAPGRVFFRDFVPPSDLAEVLNQYDMGIFVIPSKGYSLRYSLPNKFFEYLSACLPVCVGPMPEMARLIHQFSCGVVAETEEPEKVAAALNALSVNQINQMKQAAMQARRFLNAETEQQKLLQLVEALMG